MPLLAHTGLRGLAAPGRRRRRGQDRAELVLTAEQQDELRAAGYGPDGPPRDFTDPAVRAEFVAALVACGALSSAGPARSVGPRPTRRVG
jgi:hypothetical protein